MLGIFGELWSFRFAKKLRERLETDVVLVFAAKTVASHQDWLDAGRPETLQLVLPASAGAKHECMWQTGNFSILLSKETKVKCACRPQKPALVTQRQLSFSWSACRPGPSKQFQLNSQLEPWQFPTTRAPGLKKDSSELYQWLYILLVLYYSNSVGSGPVQSSSRTASRVLLQVRVDHFLFDILQPNLPRSASCFPGLQGPGHSLWLSLYVYTMRVAEKQFSFFSLQLPVDVQKTAFFRAFVLFQKSSFQHGRGRLGS